MFSIRKWIAAKMFTPISSAGGSQQNGSTDNGLSFLRSLSRNLAPGGSPSFGEHIPPDFSLNSDLNSEARLSYFYNIYSHYQSLSDKNLPINEKILITDMYQFYYANEELNFISSELDTFDGRKDTDRCSALVNSLKLAQDRVITLIFRIMDEIYCERSSREYRLKFPDELLIGEGTDSLNSQIWFGAECLAAGSTITNNQAESNYLRPIANNLTTILEQVRYDLRACCDYLPKRPKISKELVRRLESFDKLFTSFEYDYVKAMLPIKSSEDIESLQELTYLFSDTLSYSLKKGLISKDDVEGCQPNVMIALPRLSIVRGLLQGYGSVVCKFNCDELSSILKPYHSLLLKFHELLITLNEEEIDYLEQLLSTKDQSELNDKIDVLDESSIAKIDDNVQVIAPNFPDNSKDKEHNGNKNESEDNHFKTSLNRYISASVDLLLIHNKSDYTDDSVNQSTSNQSCMPHKILLRNLSLPNINIESRINDKPTTSNQRKKNTGNNKSGKVLHGQTPSSTSSATFASTTSSLAPSTSSNSYQTSSSIASSSSASSLSIEVDRLNQFREILNRSQSANTAANHHSETTQVRSISSNCPPSLAQISNNFNDINRQDSAFKIEAFSRSNSHQNNNHSSFILPTPTTSAFSNNSIHFELDSVYFDESHYKIRQKKILHQFFVMISRIADQFQTNYASELRNILRTVFHIQEMEDESELEKQDSDISHLHQINVKIGYYSNESVDFDNIEEGIDANEFLLRQENSPFNILASTSQPSHQLDQQTSQIDFQNCDNIPSTIISIPNSRRRRNSYEEALDIKQFENYTTQTVNSQFTSSSYPSVKDNPSHDINIATVGQLNCKSQSLPSIADRSGSSQAQPNHYSNSINASSSNSLFSSQSAQQSQITTSPGGTTLDDHNSDFATFILPCANSFNSSSIVSPSMIPILGNMSGPSPSATRNLLLPPIWIPDEYENTCSACAQVFNLIRRRHHCRRCGHIFCNQCSNNFISLQCFGYAKPVRVCKDCLIVHQQSSQNVNQHVPSTRSSTSSYGA